MSALFIGPYRQNDGWGCASRDYIKAIHTQISDLSCKPLYYTPRTFSDLDSDIKLSMAWMKYAFLLIKRPNA